MGLRGRVFGTTSCGPPGPIVGTFLVGQQTVGPRRYEDAVCDPALLCGEAICGAWWAHPCPAGLQLGGYLPSVTITAADEVPAAGIALGAWTPAVRVSYTTPEIPQAGLRLGALVPAVPISTVIVVSPAGLLLGAYVPDAVEILFIHPLDCLDLDLASDPERELVLVAAGSTDIDLDPLECR